MSWIATWIQLKKIIHASFSETASFYHRKKELKTRFRIPFKFICDLLRKLADFYFSTFISRPISQNHIQCKNETSVQTYFFLIKIRWLIITVITICKWLESDFLCMHIFWSGVDASFFILFDLTYLLSSNFFLSQQATLNIYRLLKFMCLCVCRIK